jgi:hypothetical protein
MNQKFMVLSMIFMTLSSSAIPSAYADGIEKDKAVVGLVGLGGISLVARYKMSEKQQELDAQVREMSEDSLANSRLLNSMTKENASRLIASCLECENSGMQPIGEGRIKYYVKEWMEKTGQYSKDFKLQKNNTMFTVLANEGNIGVRHVLSAEELLEYAKEPNTEVLYVKVYNPKLTEVMTREADSLAKAAEWAKIPVYVGVIALAARLFGSAVFGNNVAPDAVSENPYKYQPSTGGAQGSNPSSAAAN